MAKEKEVAEKKKYSLTVVTQLSAEGDGFNMAESTVTWNDLDYFQATVLEDLLIDVLQKTTELGYGEAVAKGIISADDLASRLTALEKIKGKKK